MTSSRRVSVIGTPVKLSSSTVLTSDKLDSVMPCSSHSFSSQQPSTSQATTGLKKPSRQSMIKKRTTRFVLAVVISFLCAWSPFWIFQIVVLFTESQSVLLQVARNLTLITVYFEGVINPLLFLILTENFRDFFFSKLNYILKKK